MSDNTPTQRFDAQPPATESEKRSSRLPLILGIVGGILLIAVIVLLVLLLGRGTSSPSAAGTDSPIPTDSSGATTPVPTPTVTVTVVPPQHGNAGGSAPQKPNGNNVLITQYSISPTTVDCSSGAPAGSTDLHISWKSVNGNAAYFGVETVDAQAAGEGFANLPLSGTEHDFPSGYDPFTYVCGDAKQDFTLTIVGIGSRQSLTITVHRK
jgi:hypothetical protein